MRRGRGIWATAATYPGPATLNRQRWAGRSGLRRLTVSAALRSTPVPPDQKPTLPITGHPEADELLVRDPLALTIGMLLDQQVR